MCYMYIYDIYMYAGGNAEVEGGGAGRGSE